jgi:DNA-binding transcriptional LysR family regulator
MPASFEDGHLLLCVIEAGGLGKAAERLGLAKSVVSRRLTRLERSLGANLITRSARGVALTPTGAAFCERARDLLSDWDELQRTTSRSHGQLAGRIRMTLPLTFGLRYISPLLNEFMSLHAGIELEVDFSDRPAQLPDEGLDLALRIGPPQDSALLLRRLCPIHYAACASPGYLRHHGPITTPAQLAQHPLLAFSGLASTGSWEYRLEGEKAGKVNKGGKLRMTTRLMANNGDHLVSAAASGLGVIIEPTFIVEPAVARKELVPILPQVRWRTAEAHLLYPKTRLLSARVRALVEFLVERMAGTPPWDQTISKAFASEIKPRRGAPSRAASVKRASLASARRPR